MPLNDLHKALLSPTAYPDETGPIEFRETHVSRLYLTPRHVYKIKKPVDFGFLNFTTLDRRRFYCQEEVRLNRRFCPDTYLGVVEFRRRDGKIRLDGDGEIVDYGVQMNRLPEDLMLNRLIETQNPDLLPEMDRLGRCIARFHQESEIVRSEGGRSSLDAVKRNWQENFTQTEPFLGSTLSPLAQQLCTGYVDTFLQARGPMILEREQDGFVIDGHGDLHAEHICLTDPVRVYDCIEFNRRFRIGDAAADLAFLLMDLEFRGRSDLSNRLLEAYLGTTGADFNLQTLLPFYKIYRAWVRGKVESFLSADTGAESAVRDKAITLARRYFNLALGYLSPPVMLLTCGLMGTGKTTVGTAVAAALGAVMLRSDVVRKQLAGVAVDEKRTDEFETGIYTREMSQRTYEHLLQEALTVLRRAQPVVVDASFMLRSDRERFRQAAAAARIPCLTLFMHCDRQNQHERLASRQLQQDASDGRPELLERQAENFEAPDDETSLIVVDTSRNVDYNANSILAQVLEKAGIRQ